MVKNEIVRFIVPIITCCLVVIACVVPARATDTSFFPNQGNIYQSVANVDMEIGVSKNDDSELDSTFIHPLAVIGVENYLQEEYFLMHGGPGIGDNQYGTFTALTDVTQYDTTNGAYKRIRNRLSLRLQDYGSGGYSLKYVEIHVGSWAYPSFDNTGQIMLNNAFVVTGAGDYIVQADIKYVTRQGIVESFRHQGAPHTVGSNGTDASGNTTTNYGRATAFYWAEIENMRAQMTEYNGGWILFENIKVRYVPTKDVNIDPMVGFDVIGDKLDTPTYFPSQQYHWSQFYANNDIYSSWPPSGTGGDIDNLVGDFVTGALDGFFETEIAEGVTMGGIFITVVSACLALWILKLFAGG